MVRQVAQHVVMNAPTHRVPVEANLTQVSIVAESASLPDVVSTTQFAQVLLTAKKIGGLATVSNEILETNVIGLSDYLFQAMSERIARTEDFEAFDGNGTNFTGLSITAGVTSLTASGTAASGGVGPTYGDLAALVYSARERATRQSGFLMLHPAAMKNIVSLVDSQGMPIFQFGTVPNDIP